MSAVDTSAIEVPDRLRAALLWDLPRIGPDDIAQQQWVTVMRLDPVDSEAVIDDDVISLGAHAASAWLIRDESQAQRLQAQLRERGGTGRLFQELIELWVGTATGDDATAVRACATTVALVSDPELRARLFLRLTNYALLRADRVVAREVIEPALDLTDSHTRLGVVVRRAASVLGVETDAPNPFTRSGTEDDPLLSLPWVREVALDAVTSLATKDFETTLSGAWDSSMHFGRTRTDDLLAAHAQAEWCGVMDLRQELARLLAPRLMDDPSTPPEQVAWALTQWILDPLAKQVLAAVDRVERRLKPHMLRSVLEDVRQGGHGSPRAYSDASAGLWDLVDDATAAEVLDHLMPLVTEPSLPRAQHTVAALLWRTPEVWLRNFGAADEATRAALMSSLTPDQVEVFPANFRKELLRTAEWPALLAAVAALEDGPPRRGDLRPADALRLLQWRPRSLPQDDLSRLVDSLLGAADRQLREAAEGKWGMGEAGIRQQLGHLAAHLDQRRPDVIEHLMATCASPHAAATWQLGALDGLQALLRAGRLEAEDVRRIYDLDITPGTALFGEWHTVELLQAARLRAAAPLVTSDDVSWLAAHAREKDVQTRIYAIAALGEVAAGSAAREWSLVGGLFDPVDDVVEAAIASIARSSIESDASLTLVRSRLRRLYSGSGRSVRREIVALARAKPELDLGDVIAAAVEDRSWIVRREALTPLP